MEGHNGLYHGGVYERLFINRLLGVSRQLGRSPVRSDRDQARYITARHKRHPVGIDPRDFVALGPHQQGRSFDHVNQNAVGEAHLHADVGQIRKGAAQVRFDLGWDGFEDGLPDQAQGGTDIGCIQALIAAQFSSRNDECVGGPHAVQHQTQQQGQSGRDPARAKLG